MGFEWLASKNYKRHFICLKCHKGFKRPSEEDMRHSESSDLSNLMDKYYALDSMQDIVKFIFAAHEKLKVVCPHCKNKMVQVHYDFEVPPQRDVKSWKNILKSTQAKTKLNFDSYIIWHKLELKKTTKGSSRQKILNENLAKLINSHL